MFIFKKYKLLKEKKANEEKLKKLHGREIRYVSTRDPISYGETVMGKNGVIDVSNEALSLICNEKIIFSCPIKDLYGSDLMSLDGMILSRSENGFESQDKVIVYYKYYRKVD